MSEADERFMIGALVAVMAYWIHSAVWWYFPVTAIAFYMGRWSKS